jgi:hypothetical protein
MAVLRDTAASTFMGMEYQQIAPKSNVAVECPSTPRSPRRTPQAQRPAPAPPNNTPKFSVGSAQTRENSFDIPLVPLRTPVRQVRRPINMLDRPPSSIFDEPVSRVSPYHIPRDNLTPPIVVTAPTPTNPADSVMANPLEVPTSSLISPITPLSSPKQSLPSLKPRSSPLGMAGLLSGEVESIVVRHDGQVIPGPRTPRVVRDGNTVENMKGRVKGLDEEVDDHGKGKRRASTGEPIERGIKEAMNEPLNGAC